MVVRLSLARPLVKLSPTSELEVWAASAARVLEAQQARLLPDTLDEPVDEAAVNALRSAAKLLEQNVARVYGSTTDLHNRPGEVSW